MIHAEQIRAARAALQRSQAAFGERFGVDPSTIHRWETVGPSRRRFAQTRIRDVLASLPTIAQPSASKNAETTGDCA